MNRIDTNDLNWAGQVMVFRAVCKNFKGENKCTNCPNCAHFKLKMNTQL